ncbi:hypothetical protein Nepgr_025931 [Nepenthes gracilis]|uniref:Uncharacterized protein n=1 Tax=Nepenthes gracilis TaxID=150966 RepID=A0AAD3Y049_NEPGR|nr:hypothetical protein Nepgr_025931 [Nepenthes gracilis]
MQRAQHSKPSKLFSSPTSAGSLLLNIHHFWPDLQHPSPISGVLKVNPSSSLFVSGFLKPPPFMVSDLTFPVFLSLADVVGLPVLTSLLQISWILTVDPGSVSRRCLSSFLAFPVPISSPHHPDALIHCVGASSCCQSAETVRAGGVAPVGLWRCVPWDSPAALCRPYPISSPSSVNDALFTTTVTCTAFPHQTLPKKK